ncbi:MAG: Na(+)-translocating NADH-quinone reductase subunit A [Dysgonamonadaceae bacterium]|jgi:Na+-transporting NADH:ubiquinone oxidoreductase subunit A|nr:Na(+)-translocating NADH-quinone reductase subunit A [Dysgonamonadaceae bacterium]
MTQIIKLKRGLDIPLKGMPREVTKHTIRSSYYTLFPDDYTGFTPKVVVKQGDEVLTGNPVMYDKNHPELKIVSPVSGVVTAINRGEKRKLQSIVILADAKNEPVDFGRKKINDLSPETIKSALADAGILALFRQRPYDRIVHPADTPRDIFISGFSSAPLAPGFDYILKGHEADFQTGLEALAMLTSGNVYLGVRAGRKGIVPDTLTTRIGNLQIVAFEGAHPTGNVGVQINRMKPVNKGEIVWTVQPQDVIITGRFFNKGVVDMTRLVALTGSEVNECDRAYYPMLPGASIEKLVKSSVTEHIALRYISGNVLTGKRIASDGSLHAGDNQVTVIPEGDETHEVLGWAMPRPGQFSVSRTYPAFLLERLTKKKYEMDARIKGGRRAMIMSNEWEKVFPMDILPEFLVRAILAQDIDKMENLGIYEVAPEDFALCEFVDTSKMELQKIVREGLDWFYKEMS